MYGFLSRVFSKISRVFASLSVRLSWRETSAELKRIPELAHLYERYHASPEGKWTIGENDVVNLYSFVRAHKPARILELGMGIGLSTAVMALALKHSGSAGHVVGVEQLAKCIAIANELLPEELAHYVEMVEAPPHAFTIPGISKYHYFCGYDWTPPAGTRFDMVFLDGPTGWLEDGDLVSPDNGDLHQFLPYLTEGALIYVDGRRGAVKMVERYLADHLKVLDRTSEYTVLTVATSAKDMRDITVRDRKLEALKGIVYFPKAT